MAKKKVNVDLLKQIDVGFVDRLSRDDAEPLIAQNLIEANVADVVDGKALVRLTQKGKEMVTHTNVSPVATNGAGENYEILSNVSLPARKRLGRTGGTTSALSATISKLDVGQTFFVAGADKVKKLASTISAQNMKYAEKTGEKKSVVRSKRGAGNKAMTDEQGNKIKETVQVDVYKPTRKFAMRGIKAGQVVGNWTAPADGVLIGREQ